MKLVSYLGKCSQMSGLYVARIVEDVENHSSSLTGSQIREMIKCSYPRLYESLSLHIYNPDEDQSFLHKERKIAVYVHSAKKYFFEVED